MNKILVIIIFIFIALLGNIIFNNEQMTKKESNKKYLPPGYVIGSIWIFIFGLLGYIYSKINLNKKNASQSQYVIILFLIFCFLYGPLTNGKSSRFIKNYNYLTLLFLVYVSYMISKNSEDILYLFIPIYLWVLYIFYVTLLDDLDKIQLFK
jgi:tryptophan-rich sensory protein